jgi:hypothetical protein
MRLTLTKFAARTREQAVAAANASFVNTPRYCARWTRSMFGVPALGDFDGDTAADAEDMWKAATLPHPGDVNPPAGVPVFYGGGSSDNGHAAVSLGGGMIRSTDARGAGRVGTVALDFPTTSWGMPYLGWTEDLYGHAIVSEEAARLTKWRTNLRSKRARITRRLGEIRTRLANLD